jgi:tetratricopeptide (TPR) repeat protein
LAAPVAPGQIGGGHTLFGDFKVDDSKIKGPKPETFHLTLITTSGQAVSRDSVTNNGRYRFFNIPNGEYVIVVEMETIEVARINIRLSDRVKSDIQRDISLEWSEDPRQRLSRTSASVSVADEYQRTPENQTRFTKALDFAGKNDYARAISLLEEIVNADPKDFVAWAELGTMYFRQDDLDRSEKSYRRALDEHPSFILALLNLGKLQMAQKRYDRAIESLGRAVQTDPRRAEAHYFLGESFLQIKRGSIAVRHLNEAIKLDPVGMAEAHLRLGALYHAAGLKDRAAGEYEQFLAKKPGYSKKKDLERYISEHKNR